MRKQILFAIATLISAPAFAQIEVVYPEYVFQGPEGAVSVSVHDICHEESDDTLKTVRGENTLAIERTKDTPLVVEVPIIQTFADGTRHAVGMDYYRIRACN